MSERLGKIHDVREELARNPHSIASLTVLPANREVAGHVHVNPYLSLHVLGSYKDNDHERALSIDGPAALFFPAGSAHEMRVGGTGLATIIIEFDAAVLQRAVGAPTMLRRSRSWIGGEFGREARRLARGWLAGNPPDRQLALTIAFLRSALLNDQTHSQPAWLQDFEARLDTERSAPDVERWAHGIGISRPWLARAYRRWRGEGLSERIQRKRVEAAAMLLETSDLPLAEIAAGSGFCDQSHMNRAFNKHLGRTPAATRKARLGLSETAQTYRA